MDLRKLAEAVIAMRRCVTLSMLADFRGNDDSKRYHLKTADLIAESLPLGMRRSIALARYVGDPVQRQFERVGILTMAERWGK